LASHGLTLLVSWSAWRQLRSRQLVGSACPCVFAWPMSAYYSFLTAYCCLFTRGGIERRKRGRQRFVGCGHAQSRLPARLRKHTRAGAWRERKGRTQVIPGHPSLRSSAVLCGEVGRRFQCGPEVRITRRLLCSHHGREDELVAAVNEGRPKKDTPSAAPLPHLQLAAAPTSLRKERSSRNQTWPNGE